MSIVLKEANETDYLLSLLKDTDYISAKEHESISPDCIELIKLLTSTINTAKKNLTNK